MNQKGFILPLIAIIIVVATGIGGYVFVQRQKVKNENAYVPPVLNPYADAPQSSTSASTSTLTTAAIPADWKTYRNEKYGFEVKYPKDWKQGIQHDPNSMRDILTLTSTSTLTHPYCIKYGCPPDITISVLDISSFRELEEIEERKFQRNGETYNMGGWKNMIINGYPADAKLYAGEGTTLYVYFAGNNKLYAVGFNGAGPLDTLPTINRQVLSTFKFIK